MAKNKTPRKPRQMALPLPEMAKVIQPADFNVVVTDLQGFRIYLDATPEALQPLIQRGWKVVQWLNEGPK